MIREDFETHFRCKDTHKLKEMIKEGHYIMIKRSIEQEDIMYKYLCTHKYMKQLLTDIKGEIAM